MDLLSVILLIVCIVLILALFVVSVLLAMALKRYKILSNLFEFYDELFNKIISLTSTIDNEATKVLNSSLLDGNAEIKKIFIYIRKLRDSYRTLTKEYNNKNTYGNKVIIEDLND